MLVARLTVECHKLLNGLFLHTTHESSRTTLAPSSLFRLGKILISVNTGYHQLHVLKTSTLIIRARIFLFSLKKYNRPHQGFEPGIPWFAVRCHINWATAPHIVRLLLLYLVLAVIYKLYSLKKKKTVVCSFFRALFLIYITVKPSETYPSRLH